MPPFKETQNYIKKINGYLNNKSTTGATVLTYNTKKPAASSQSASAGTASAAETAYKAAANQAVIPSGLQLKRMSEENGNASATTDASKETSILDQVGLSSTDQITNVLRKLEASGEVQDTNDVFSYEDYLKFVDLFYVQEDEENKENAGSKSDAEVARIQMSASISGMLKSL